MKAKYKTVFYSADVKIAKGAKLKNCVIMQDTCVGTDCNLQNVITDKDVMIQDGRSFMGTDTYPVFVSKGALYRYQIERHVIVT